MQPYYERSGIRLYHGDCREVAPSLGEQFAAVVTDPLFLRLDQRISAAMAGRAERHQIVEAIGVPIVIEQAKGADVVNVTTGRAAVLASEVIPSPRRPSLRLPVRTTPDNTFTDVLRVKRADAVTITTLPRAILALARTVVHMARTTVELGTAADTGQRDDSLIPTTDERVLAGGRARLASTDAKPGRAHDKRRATDGARSLYERDALRLLANAKLDILGVHLTDLQTGRWVPCRGLYHQRLGFRLPQLYRNSGLFRGVAE